VPKEYASKHGLRFRKKTELALELLKEELSTSKVPRDRITFVTDTFYASEEILGFVRREGLKFVAGLKPKRRIRLFSTWIRVKDYFKKKRERYFTWEGRRIYYKQAVLHVKKLGRAMVFAFREEGSEEWRYYVTNDLKMTPRTCHEYRRRRWQIDKMHREEKQFCGLCNTCSWKVESLVPHYKFSFFLWWMFERFRLREGLEVSFEALWWEYKAEVDKAKARRMQLGEPPPLEMFFNYV
jgi:hypothetical protein